MSSSQITPNSVSATTTYIVLKENEDGAWERVKTYGARDAQTAIKETAATLASGDQPGVYVAVPARSWQPMKVTPKVETTLVLEEAKS